MATDEEYLDSLLKSMTDNEQNRSMEEVMREVTKTPKEDDETFALEDILENPQEMTDDVPESKEDILPIEENTLGMEADTHGIEESVPEMEENTPNIEDVVLETERSTSEAEGEVSSSEIDEWELGLDEILSQADSQSGEDNTEGLFDMSDWASADQSMDVLEPVSEDTGSVNMDSMDVTDLIDNMDNTDLDLAEINGLLKRADSKENINDEMLALLEGVDVTQMDDFTESDPEFAIFSESDLEKSANYVSGSDDSEGNSKGRKKKEKKAKKEKTKSKRLGKKKKESGAAEENEEELQDGLNLDNLLNGAEDDSEDGDSGQKEKKSGFFSKIMDFITEEDEEEEENADGNPASVDGAGEEGDKEASKKNKKSKKADKKGKKGKDKEELSEEEADEEAEGKSKAKKKPKKEKKEKPPKEKVKGEKILSTKKLMVLVAFCATIIACIMVFSTFLPEYVDKQNAREAFYEGDYETVYKLLYDKQLNNSDSIIFNRAEIVLKLERKLQSYNNNMALNRELEAVDALIQGVNYYNNLISTETYGAREELDVLYRQICSILESSYGITPETAAEMNTYDNVQYTMELNAIISGTKAAY
ncbi:MAG: hypothetical protein K2N15_10635 [Lachnospiraceae bacterium]|nr:hypothetical protein [Lachnospiraceae bacterium]